VHLCPPRAQRRFLRHIRLDFGRLPRALARHRHHTDDRSLSVNAAIAPQSLQPIRRCYMQPDREFRRLAFRRLEIGQGLIMAHAAGAVTFDSKMPCEKLSVWSGAYADLAFVRTVFMAKRWRQRRQTRPVWKKFNDLRIAADVPRRPEVRDRTAAERSRPFSSHRHH
jgi:hypothetical protein